MSFMELASSRFSVRKFSDKPIEGEKLEQILQAGRIAPTAKNCQPQRIYLLASEDAMSKINAVCRCIYGAPSCIVVAHDETRGAKGTEDLQYEGFNFAEMDATIVCTHMMLEAADLGVGSCWVGAFSRKKVHDILGLPVNEQVCALLPIGYAAEGVQPSANHYSLRDSMETVTIL